MSPLERCLCVVVLIFDDDVVCGMTFCLLSFRFVREYYWNKVSVPRTGIHTHLRAIAKAWKALPEEEKEVSQHYEQIL